MTFVSNDSYNDDTLQLLSGKVRSAVTSMILWKNEFVIVGTAISEIYQVKLSDFDMRLLVTCHTATIYDVAFPQ